MSMYRVKYEIDVEADTMEDAVEKAAKYMKGAEYCQILEVTDSDNNSTFFEIDHSGFNIMD